MERQRKITILTIFYLFFHHFIRSLSFIIFYIFPSIYFTIFYFFPGRWGGERLGGGAANPSYVLVLCICPIVE